tara:strand:- start:431 stop:721 length:291 start_codon:yes stop_codon:yes gene_type:complete
MFIRFVAEEFVVQKETYSSSGEKVFNFSMITKNPCMRFVVSCLECTFHSSAKHLLVEGNITNQKTSFTNNENIYQMITYQKVFATKIEPIEEENEN